MKKLLNRLILWPGYYALTVTLAGLWLAFFSRIATSSLAGYENYISKLDLSMASLASIGGLILVVGSLAIYDKFTRRRSLKVTALFNNEKYMWQLSCFLLTALVVSTLLVIFKKHIDNNIAVGLNISYTLFALYFLFAYLRMLFTNK